MSRYFKLDVSQVPLAGSWCRKTKTRTVRCCSLWQRSRQVQDFSEICSIPSAISALSLAIVIVSAVPLISSAGEEESVMTPLGIKNRWIECGYGLISSKFSMKTNVSCKLGSSFLQAFEVLLSSAWPWSQTHWSVIKSKPCRKSQLQLNTHEGLLIYYFVNIIGKFAHLRVHCVLNHFVSERRDRPQHSIESKESSYLAEVPLRLPDLSMNLLNLKSTSNQFSDGTIVGKTLSVCLVSPPKSMRFTDIWSSSLCCAPRMAAKIRSMPSRTTETALRTAEAARNTETTRWVFLLSPAPLL